MKRVNYQNLRNAIVINIIFRNICIESFCDPNKDARNYCLDTKIFSQPAFCHSNVFGREYHTNHLLVIGGRIIVVPLTIVMLFVSLVAPTYIWAQGIETWSPQAPIPDYDVFTEKPPFLVADQANTVHAFNSQSIDDSKRLVIYRQWSVNQGWSEPNDIFASSQNDIELLGLYMDQEYVVHLVMNIGSHIFYSYAPLVHAGRASAWSIPTLVGEQAQNPLHSTIVGDGQGNLVILYAGTADGNGLYMVTSNDNGETWSTSQVMSLSPDPGNIIAGINALFAESGMIHFVWNEYDRAGVGVAGYYANYDPHQATLANVQELDEGSLFLGIQFPTIFEYQANLIVTYYNGKTNGHYWRLSKNDGQTWTEPVRLTPDHVGTNGPVSYAVDSNNVLHLFFGERIDDNSHGVWHLTWTGNGWANLESVVRGPQIRDISGGKGFDPHSAKGIVVNGNLLFVAWGTDGHAGVNGAWYSYKFIDTPQLPAEELPVLPLFVQNVTPTPAVTVTEVPTPLPTTKPVKSYAGENQVRGVGTPRILIVAVVPSIVVISVTLLLAVSIPRRL